MITEELFLVTLQSLCVVVLSAIGIWEITTNTNKLSKKLNRLGKVLLFVSSVVYIFSTVRLLFLSVEKNKDLMKSIKDLNVELLEQVMTAPPEIVPEIPEMNILPDSLQITAPVNNSIVRKQRVDVIGRVSDLKSDVWVIVHPVGLSAYWVQPSVAVRKDGSWQVPVYVGRAGDIDVGKEFDIMAVADPEPKLNEGRILSEWPKAKWRSDIVTVVRK